MKNFFAIALVWLSASLHAGRHTPFVGDESPSASPCHFHNGAQKKEGMSPASSGRSTASSQTAVVGPLSRVTSAFEHVCDVRRIAVVRADEHGATKLREDFLRKIGSDSSLELECVPELKLTASPILEEYLELWQSARAGVLELRRWLVKFRLFVSVWYRTVWYTTACRPVSVFHELQMHYKHYRAVYDACLNAAVGLQLGVIVFPFGEKWPGNQQYPTDFKPLGALAPGVCYCGAKLSGDPSCPSCCATCVFPELEGEDLSWNELYEKLATLRQSTERGVKAISACCEALEP